MYFSIIKPLVDFLIALVVVLLFSPILLLVYVIIFLSSMENPIFLQKRPGLKGKVFTIIKFRTMTNERDENGELLPDEQRITTIGKIIRKTSLDEIPQLFNVIKGEMSLIGPRPLLVSYLPLYNEEQARRHDVRPGITGWAQVNGRDAISFGDKFKLDVYYVDHVSLLLDLKIIIKSIVNVLLAKDESPESAVTNEAWKGNGS